MAEYKRWISYIYNYENNEKKNNVGYIRVSTRGDESKLSIHINSVMSDKRLPVYIFFRNEGNIEGVCIGELAVDKGLVQGTLAVCTYNVVNSGCGLSEAGGVIVYDNAERYYASEWDDSSINIEEFTTVSKVEYAKTEDVNREESNEYEMKEEMKEEMREEMREGEMEEEMNEEENNETETNEVETNEMKDNQEDKNNEIISAVENMLASYPYMYPFEDDAISMCVRVEPQDISELPIDTWVIANNSFLLNGYYSYRHLILMKTADENKPVYLLGVPGIFKTRDDFLARMFGFKMFKPLKDTCKVKGEFGYWCISLTEVVNSELTMNSNIIG